MEMSIALGTILVLGYFFGLIAERLGFPRVTSYLLAGILFSQDLLGDKIPLNLEHWSDLFSNICLGFIAYIVGSDIHVEKLYRHGKVTLYATFLSSLLPVLFVFTSFYIVCSFFGLPSILGIVLASIASSTDPAAIVAVIDQYKVKGEMAETTLKIVALDDALGVIIFALVSIFFMPNSFGGEIELITRELGGSILLGAILGFSLSRFTRLSISNDYLLPLLTGLVLLAVGLAEFFHLSSLMVCIVLGFVASSTHKKESSKLSLLLPVRHIKELIFIIFFTLAGTHFSLQYFMKGYILIFTYIIARGLGKYTGAYVGAKLGHTDNLKIPKYLGLTLLPQAGVAIGLVIQVVQVPEIAPLKDMIFNIILGSTIIYEVFGPVLAKIAFRKVGEIG